METPIPTVLFFFLVIWASKNVESAPAPSPSADCSTLILNLADCLTYVIGGSTVKTPEGTCCTGLKTVLKTDPECLCEGFKNSGQLGVTLNITKALALPSACHVSAPSLSNCGQGAVSPSTTGGVATSSVGTNPAAAPASSDSVALTASIGSVVVVLVAASFTLV
ncbi:hypothetical protein ACSBR1_022605 [Camellia fascicularis]